MPMSQKSTPANVDERNGEAQQLAELVLQLSRAAYAECPAGGPTQAQWQALRFFARANRFSRNVTGFAEFHATTRGTASQTVKSLTEQGYLVRIRSEKDGRSARFDLTDSARELLQDDPLERVVRSAAKLNPEHKAQTVSCLKEVMETLARDKRRPMTGLCTLCGHLNSGDDGTFQCGLMREALTANELQELCIRYHPAASCE
jgi:DNA-binding MarR family transcriptional regulator